MQRSAYLFIEPPNETVLVTDGDSSFNSSGGFPELKNLKKRTFTTGLISPRHNLRLARVNEKLS